jgi:hypothetical protein
MKATKIIITLIILMASCKFQTKKEKLKQEEERFCELAYLYISECAYEYKKIRVSPLKSCNTTQAQNILSSSCEDLLKGLSHL